MQAETRTLTQLFQLDVRYVVPLYQRPYVWTEERQWAPLWEDIATVANHVVLEGASAQSPVHFLGAIVIQQEENPPGAPQRYLVIDGQQRLTTLQLLLAAAARTAEARGCADEGKLLRRLTANDPLLAKGEERFKVWPTNANRAAFVTVMEQDGSSDDPNNEIQQAYAYFCRQIRSWVTDDEDDGSESSPEKQFSALRVTLSDLLKLVSIRLEDGDSPQVIFETLNGRGTPLIALDLLKNAVFLEAAREQVDTDHLYNAHWAPELDRDYWREDRRAGRLFTKNGDMFLQYWLVAELAEPVPSTELFDIFRKRILLPATCPPMVELIPTLARDAVALRHFQSAEVGSPDRRFVELLEQLDTTTLMPIALLLLRSNQISAERRAQAFAVLESFLVRRMLCGWTTKNYNRLAAALVGEIKKDLAHADTLLQNRLASETASANRWPRDDDLHAALHNKDMYGQRRQDRLVMVLWRLEEHLRAADNKVEQGLAAPSKLTLEHLIPQAWESHWPLDENQDDPTAWRNNHLHKFGNLTLTTGPLNSSLSNLPWHASQESKDKRRSLLQHSLLKLNTSVVHDYPERFDEHAVDERGARLAELVNQLWPGPEAHSQSRVEDKSADKGNNVIAQETADEDQLGIAPPVAMDRGASTDHLQQGHPAADMHRWDGRPGQSYRLYESAGYLGLHPAFAQSPDFDALRRWAVDHNKWKGEQTAAVIVSDEGRVWYVSRSGNAREASNVRGKTGGPSQVEKLIARLEGRGSDAGVAQLGYELPPPERSQHKTIHVTDTRFLGMEIEEPNDGEEHVKGAIASGTMSEKSKLYWDFWEQFRARVVSEHPDWTKRNTSTRDYWYDLATGISGAIFTTAFASSGLAIQLAFNDVRPNVNLARFEALYRKKDQFERALGEEVVWDEMTGRKGTRVYVTSPFDNVEDVEQWPAMVDWLLDHHARLRRAIHAVGGLGS